MLWTFSAEKLEFGKKFPKTKKQKTQVKMIFTKAGSLCRSVFLLLYEKRVLLKGNLPKKGLLGFCIPQEDF